MVILQNYRKKTDEFAKEIKFDERALGVGSTGHKSLNRLLK